jgi:hypothetical protein
VINGDKFDIPFKIFGKFMGHIDVESNQLATVLRALSDKETHLDNFIVDSFATMWHKNAFINWKKTMKELFTKIIQTIIAILIFCIVVYGIVYAQQVCCSTIVDACLPIFKMISVGYNSDYSCRISPSHNRNNQQQPILCSKNIIAVFGSGNTCCETDRCDGYNQATEFSLSFIQDFYALQKNIGSFEAGNGARATFGPYNLSTAHKAIPIYILTESIIC